MRVRTLGLVVVVVVAGSVTLGLESCGSNGTSPCSSDCDASGSDAKLDAPGDSGFTGLPPVHAACASPTITLAGTLALDAGGVMAPPAATWGGVEAAAAYFQGGAINLQRLTGGGQLIGDPIRVGDAPAYDVDLGVASDGNVYLVCWTTGDTPYWHVHCASVSMATNAVTPGFATTGNAQGGSVAYGPGGFVVAYGDQNVWAQALNADASARGAPVQVAPYVAQAPYLVPTSSGYLVGLVGQILVYRLDAALGVSPPTDFADARVSYGLAASGDTVGLDYVGDPDSGVILGMTAANGTGAPSNFVVGSDAACQQTSGFVAQAAGGVDSFAFTWAMSGSVIGYRAFGADGAALGPAVATPSLLSSCPFPWHTTIAVADGFLIVTTSGGASALSVFHVACP